jgi:hypothetical protein
VDVTQRGHELMKKTGNRIKRIDESFASLQNLERLDIAGSFSFSLCDALRSRTHRAIDFHCDVAISSMRIDIDSFIDRQTQKSEADLSSQ